MGKSSSKKLNAAEVAKARALCRDSYTQRGKNPGVLRPDITK
jgi:hypothetical protein